MTTAANPAITVLMALNRADEYLKPAIDSIRNQSLQDFEFLIVIDSLCDGLGERVIELGDGDPRIRIVTAAIGGGLAFSLNLGVAESRGKYIARMDGDDISRPQRLQQQADYLDQHPNTAIVGCRVQLIDQDSKPIPREYPYFRTNEEIRKVLPYRNPLPHPGLMLRKSAILAVQGYKYGHFSEDHEMFIRMARDPKVEFYNLDETLFEYRRHSRQLTSVANMRRHYSEISGFLYTEFLLTHSPKYLLGMLVVHPWLRRARLKLRKWRRGTDL